MKTEKPGAEARMLAGLRHPCVIAIYGRIIGQVSVAGFRTSEISCFCIQRVQKWVFIKPPAIPDVATCKLQDLQNLGRKLLPHGASVGDSWK